MEPDSDEDDPAKLLSAWLGELDNLKNELDNGIGNGNAVSNYHDNGAEKNAVKKNLKSQYRCSLINLETSQNEELDAILGELTQLETKFDQQISDNKNWEVRTDKRIRFSDEQVPESTPNLSASSGSPSESAKSEQSSSSSQSVQEANQHTQEIREAIGQEENSSSGSSEIRSRVDNTSRTGSPDTDSAFCDITDSLSVLSVSSGKTDQSKTSISVPSSLHPLTQTTQAEQDAKIKAEKIKIAIEKIKEASVKKLFIKVFTSDGSAKSLLVDEKMSVGYVTRVLAEKNHVKLDPKWALVELVPDLYVERVYEDHEMLVENCLLWKVDSKNTLWFIERPEKFDLFARPEVYLLGSSSSEKDEQMEEHSRQELLEEYFSSSGIGAPQLEGQVWLKADGKKSWKKFHFVLRSSGLYYAPKGKKTSKDLVCLTTFDMNQVYYGVGWKKKYKSPSDYCFGIKHPQIQTKNPKYIRYLCVDTQRELHQWVTGIRIAKNGRHLFENHRAIVEEITHADIDILTSKRFSVNSSTGLPSLPILPHSSNNCGADDNGINSNARTPSSENKSMASALSSGIEADMSNNGSNHEEFVSTEVLPQVEPDREESNQDTPVGMLDRDYPIRRSFSRSSRSSSSSGCLSDKSSGVEQGFESNSPVGGTIKKRPAATPRLPLTSTTWSMVREVDKERDKEEGDNVRLGAGGTLLTGCGGILLRAAVRKNFSNKSDSELKSPSRAPPDSASFKQIEHPFRVASNSIPGTVTMTGSFSEDLPLPPPPSRPESVTSLADIDVLPPPPIDIWEPQGSSHYHVSPITSPDVLSRSPSSSYYQASGTACSSGNISGISTLPTQTSPKNNFNACASTQNSSNGCSLTLIPRNGKPHKILASCSNPMPAPITVPFNKRLNSSIKGASPLPTDKTKPTRRISFDDNVQLISTSPESYSPQSILKFSPIPQARPSPGRLFHNESKTHTPPKEFLADLQRVMTKKWQVAEKCRGDTDATPHKVMGFRDDLVPLQPSIYNKDSAIGAWVLETQQYVPTQQQGYQLVQQDQPNDHIQQQQHISNPHQNVYDHHFQLQTGYEQHRQPSQQYINQQQQEALYGHLYPEQAFHPQQENHIHEESLYAHMYSEQGFHSYQVHSGHQEALYGHNPNYQQQPQYDSHLVHQLDDALHPAQAHNRQKPVVLREPDMEQYLVSRPPMAAKKPPPPPRRSQNTQLSNSIQR